MATDSNSLTDKNYHLWRDFHPPIKEFADDSYGTILDIGVGEKPYIEWFDDIEKYVGVDVEQRGGADILGDGQQLPFSDNSFDIVVSFEVLEHVPNPQEFMDEVARVLVPNGKAMILTVQMYPLHETPNDYYRFTRFGLRHLVHSAGLSPTEDIEVGTLAVRLLCEINYFWGGLPNPLPTGLVIATNLILYPIRNLNHREEYIVSGIIAKN